MDGWRSAALSGSGPEAAGTAAGSLLVGAERGAQKDPGVGAVTESKGQETLWETVSASPAAPASPGMVEGAVPVGHGSAGR